MNLFVGEKCQSLLSLAIYGITNDNEKFDNISTVISLALFYGNFAYSAIDLFDENESGIFCDTSSFLIAVEYAIRLKASDGMFTADGAEFKEYQNLLNIIDVSLILFTVLYVIHNEILDSFARQTLRIHFIFCKN